jgi:hypothetical protein
LAAPLEQVGAVEAGGAHPHPDVAGLHFGLGDLAYRDHFGAAGPGKDHCFHLTSLAD